MLDTQECEELDEITLIHATHLNIMANSTSVECYLLLTFSFLLRSPAQAQPLSRRQRANLKTTDQDGGQGSLYTKLLQEIFDMVLLYIQMNLIISIIVASMAVY